ncbi:DUF4143 domain-containing protein [Legionella clemsonensis]|uniref:DUF4143 domain-containing protein n=1 Tax=Legionella clemsonensis TaxID=1867846 RepID=UPI000B8CDB7A
MKTNDCITSGTLHLCNDWSNEQIELFHFRDEYRNEVDIVLGRDNDQISGIEVKASATIKQHDVKGVIN